MEVGLLSVVLAVSFGLAAAASWRNGMLLCVVVGFGQDPLRKMAAGEPVFLSAIVIVAAALVFIVSLAQRGGRLRLFEHDHILEALTWLYVLVVCVQAVRAYLEYGTAVVSVIGMIAYLSPIPALAMASRYARRPSDLSRFLTAYCVCAVAVAATALLSFAGVESRLFKEVGEGFRIYTEYGEVNMHVGLARSPEVLAWHAATAACLLIILSVASPVRAMRVFVVGAAGILLLVGLLTARRKMLVEVAAFVALYPVMLAYFRNYREHGAMLSVMALAGMALLAVMGGVVPLPDAAGMSTYVSRGSSVFSGDIVERFRDLGLASVGWAINTAGWFGLGAGTGSQGIQHFVAGGSYAGGAAEGGIGKIIVELGVIGAAIVAVILLRAAWHLRAILWMVQKHDPRYGAVLVGLLTWLAINGIAFVAASQIYGDPFVLLMLGWFVGMVLGAPGVLAAQTNRLAPAAAGPAYLRFAPGA